VLASAETPGWMGVNGMTETGSEWSFFSNYAHVLVCLAENPHARLREVADRVGITERTAMRLITQLDEAGILVRIKQGRRNEYLIDTQERLRHTIESHCTVGEMLKMILSPAEVEAIDQRIHQFKRQPASSQA
jgi:DNA-binding Lrp family transcriptional regulator